MVSARPLAALAAMLAPNVRYVERFRPASGRTARKRLVGKCRQLDKPPPHRHLYGDVTPKVARANIRGEENLMNNLIRGFLCRSRPPRTKAWKRFSLPGGRAASGRNLGNA